MLRWARCGIAAQVAAMVAAVGCAPIAPPRTIDLLRQEAHPAPGARLLGELLLPGGDPKRAQTERSALGEDPRTPLATLGAALFDDLHGQVGSAVHKYEQLLDRSGALPSNSAHLAAWWAAARLRALSTGSASRQIDPARALERAEGPSDLGYAARTELLRLWNQKTPLQTGEFEKRLGCQSGVVRAVGPRLRPIGGELDPALEGVEQWNTVALSGGQNQASMVEVAESACQYQVPGSSPTTVMMAEWFVDWPQESSAILVVGGGMDRLEIDGVEVIRGGSTVWGGDLRSSALVHLSEGQHRIVARPTDKDFSVRWLADRGLPLAVHSSTTPSPAALLAKVKVLGDPLPLAPLVRASVASCHSVQSCTDRFLAARLATSLGSGDVAAVLLEPLTRGGATTAAVLAAQGEAQWVDHIAGETLGPRRAREFLERASKLDDGLWESRLEVIEDQADAVGMGKTIRRLRELQSQFAEVDEIRTAELDRLTAQGWIAEIAHRVDASTQVRPSSNSWMRPSEKKGFTCLQRMRTALLLRRCIMPSRPQHHPRQIPERPQREPWRSATPATCESPTRNSSPSARILPLFSETSHPEAFRPYSAQRHACSIMGFFASTPTRRLAFWNTRSFEWTPRRPSSAMPNSLPRVLPYGSWCASRMGGCLSPNSSRANPRSPCLTWR